MDPPGESHRSGAHPRPGRRHPQIQRSHSNRSSGRARFLPEGVPEAGLEPARPFGQWILNPSRLPITPLGPAARRVAKCGRERKPRSSWSSSEPAGTRTGAPVRFPRGRTASPSGAGSTGLVPQTDPRGPFPTVIPQVRHSARTPSEVVPSRSQQPAGRAVTREGGRTRQVVSLRSGCGTVLPVAARPEPGWDVPRTNGPGRESSSVSSGSPGRRRRQNHRGARQEEEP
jgi:hypothetical protein